MAAGFITGQKPEQEPEYDTTMPKFRYTGKEPQILAQVGPIVPGEVIEVSDDIAKGIRTHGADQFVAVAATVNVGPPEAKADGKPPGA